MEVISPKGLIVIASNKTFSIAFVVFIPILVLCTVVRCIQLMTIVDFDTGFFSDENTVLSSLLYVIFAVGFIILIVASFIDKKRNNKFFTKNVNQTDLSEITILGLMFLISGGVIIYNFFTQKIEGIDLLASILGGIGYIGTGLCLVIGKRFSFASGILILLPAISQTIKLVLLFMENLVITRISDYLIQLFIYILLVIFYLSAGRIFSSNDGGFTRVRAMVTGFSAAVLIISETVAKLIFWQTSPDSLKLDINMEGAVFLKPDMLNISECIIVMTILILLLRNIYEAEA